MLLETDSIHNPVMYTSYIEDQSKNYTKKPMHMDTSLQTFPVTEINFHPMKGETITFVTAHEFTECEVEIVIPNRHKVQFLQNEEICKQHLNP